MFSSVSRKPHLYVQLTLPEPLFSLLATVTFYRLQGHTTAIVADSVSSLLPLWASKKIKGLVFVLLATSSNVILIWLQYIFDVITPSSSGSLHFSYMPYGIAS